MIYGLIGLIAVVFLILYILNRKPSQKNIKSPVSNENYFELDFEDDGINYDEYTLSSEERLKYAVIGYAVMFAVSYVFYANIVISAVVGLAGLLNPRFQRNRLKSQRKDKLTLEFKDALYSIYTSLAAGESPESALKQVPDDLKELYVEEKTYIIPEFEVIRRRLELNLSIKEVLQGFADRTGVEDIENFADIFITSMDTGGRQSEIIKNAINTIVEKIEIKRDIDLMISSKKYESQIMTVMPVFVILFLAISSGDYFQPMYTTLLGRAVMTLVIIGMFIANLIAQKIMKIEV